MTWDYNGERIVWEDLTTEPPTQIWWWIANPDAMSTLPVIATGGYQYWLPQNWILA